MGSGRARCGGVRGEVPLEVGVRRARTRVAQLTCSWCLIAHDVLRHTLWVWSHEVLIAYRPPSLFQGGEFRRQCRVLRRTGYLRMEAKDVWDVCFRGERGGLAWWMGSGDSSLCVSVVSGSACSNSGVIQSVDADAGANGRSASGGVSRPRAVCKIDHLPARPGSAVRGRRARGLHRRGRRARARSRLRSTRPRCPPARRRRRGTRCQRRHRLRRASRSTTRGGDHRHRRSPRDARA